MTLTKTVGTKLTIEEIEDIDSRVERLNENAKKKTTRSKLIRLYVIKGMGDSIEGKKN